MKTSLATPRDWWEMLDEEFHFNLDAAADDQHFMCIPYYTVDENALTKPWLGVVWCSPPWYKNLEAWVEHAWQESLLRGSKIVMLLPIRPFDFWWFEYGMRAKEIRFIDGILEFKRMDGSDEGFAVEPHCLMIFEGHEGPTIATRYPARRERNRGMFDHLDENQQWRTKAERRMSWD